LPGDRIAALRAFHERGIFTRLSMEPVVGIEASLAVVAATHSFVDLYKIGRMNCLALPIDWRDYTLRMIELLNRVGAKHYIKKDLQPFLPPGYPNPMRVRSTTATHPLHFLTSSSASIHRLRFSPPEARAALYAAGKISLHKAVDKLQADALASGFVAAIGQDAAQTIMSPRRSAPSP
jgi:hypothetical protein